MNQSNESNRKRYQVFGEGETVILAGNGNDPLKTFQSLAVHLRTRYRVIILLEKINNSLISEISEEMSLKNFHLFGYTQGASAVLRYALENPGRVQSLILCGGPSLPERYSDGEVLDHSSTPLSARSGTKLKTKTVMAVVHSEFENQLGAFKVDCCLIWGAEDPTRHPRSGRALQKHIPGSRLFIVDDCGDDPLSEQPDRVHNIVDSFFLSQYQKRMGISWN